MGVYGSKKCPQCQEFAHRCKCGVMGQPLPPKPPVQEFIKGSNPAPVRPLVARPAHRGVPAIDMNGRKVDALKVVVAIPLESIPSADRPATNAAGRQKIYDAGRISVYDYLMKRLQVIVGLTDGVPEAPVSSPASSSESPRPESPPEPTP